MVMDIDQRWRLRYPVDHHLRSDEGYPIASQMEESLYKCSQCCENKNKDLEKYEKLEKIYIYIDPKKILFFRPCKFFITRYCSKIFQKIKACALSMLLWKIYIPIFVYLA